MFGHLWAVGGASLLLLIFLFGEVFIIFIRALASLSPASFFGVLAFELLFFCFLWLFVGAYTWFTGTIPIAIVFLIAEKFSIRSVWYYLSSGILSASRRPRCSRYSLGDFSRRYPSLKDV